MKKLLALVLMMSAFHVCADTTQASPVAKYKLYPVGITGSSVWLLNVETGALSKCISESINESPICAPWAEPPGKNPEYRYERNTKKMIPMNQAARNKEKEKAPANRWDKYEVAEK